MTKALITGVSKMKGNLDVVVENCTFIAMKTGMTFFDLKPSNTDNFNVTVKIICSAEFLMAQVARGLILEM